MNGAGTTGVDKGAAAVVAMSGVGGHPTGTDTSSMPNTASENNVSSTIGAGCVASLSSPSSSAGKRKKKNHPVAAVDVNSANTNANLKSTYLLFFHAAVLLFLQPIIK